LIYGYISTTLITISVSYIINGYISTRFITISVS
jgi:hypothetical protein